MFLIIKCVIIYLILYFNYKNTTMLHTIQQYKKLFSYLLFTNLVESTVFRVDEFNSLSEREREQYLKNNVNLLKNYLSMLDSNKDNLIVFSKNSRDLYLAKDETALRNILRSL